MATHTSIKKMMAMKLETASGTAETLVDADCDLHFFDITVDPEIEVWANNLATGRHSKGAAVMGKRKITIGAKHALRTSSALGTAPKLGKAFKACGLTETIVASTSVTYTPNATKDEGDGITSTIKIFYLATSGNAVIVTAKGCMGDCTISMDSLGNPLVASFTFTGAFVGITDGAALVVTGPDTSIPNAVLGSAVTAATVPMQIAKMSLPFGNSVQVDQDPANASGYLAAYIGNRDPKWMWDPKMKLLGTDPHYTRWSAGTEFTLSLKTAIVGTQVITVAAPKAQIIGMKMADRDEATTFDQEMELHETTGNDEFSIAWAAT